MKKINFDEEFQVENTIFMFSKNDGEVKLKVVRKSKGKSVFQSPSLEEVKEFFKSKGYTEESAAKFHEYYGLGDWKDSKGTQVRSWKQKAASVWFKHENRPKVIEEAKGIKFFQ